MTSQHVRLECDAPGCDRWLLSEPLDFRPASEAEKALLLYATSRGWYRSTPGASRAVRHYCPTHAPRATFHQPPHAPGQVASTPVQSADSSLSAPRS